MNVAELDRRLQYGPGMRAQRLAEAGFLMASFFTNDIRFAYVTLGLAGLQAISGRLVPIALVVSLFVRPPRVHHLSDVYFDLAGSRGSCAMSAIVIAVGIWFVRAGHEAIGYALLTMPAASFLLAPTVGFCSGCAVYVGLRDVLVRLGLAKRYANGACDIDIDTDRAKAPDRQ